MIKVEHISKELKKKKLVDDVSFTVTTGETVGLIGPNGAGKSTLLSIIAGTTEPSSGRVTFDSNQKNTSIGYVPQDIALYDRLSVYENLKFWGELAGGSTSLEHVQRIAEQVQLKDHLQEKVYTLSGGNQRKVNIAAALIHHPSILLMDEPTVGIDIQSKHEIVQLLKQLGNEGKTIIYISHDIAEIEELCDRFIYLKNGRVVNEGNPKDISVKSLFV